MAIASTSQIVNWTDCFGGKIAYKAGMSYVFKARIKQPNSKRGVMFCAVYDDNTYQFMSAPPSPTASELYEAVYMYENLLKRAESACCTTKMWMQTTTSTAIATA